MRNWTRIGGAALMVAFVVAAAAQGRPDEEKPLTDAEFTKKAYGGNLTEVELGKIAKQRATDPDVKKFAEKLIADHTKANEELMKIAKEANLPVPEKPDADQQKHIDMFRDYRGSDFDRAFMKHMVEDHEKDVKMFTRATRELKDERLKGFAEKTLPTLKDHLDMAKKIHERLEKK